MKPTTRNARKERSWVPEMEPTTRKARRLGRHGDTEGTEGTEAKAVNGGLGVEAYREQVLPGIPDDITLSLIAPKLQWRSLCSLASVSAAWLQAVRSREFYDTRVVYRALESLVLVRCRSIGSSFDSLDLYSTRDGFYFKLPPLPGCERGISGDCECVTLDGRIYAFGGIHLDFCLVYALDLVGPKQWKQCASMRQKASFRCATLDGKVYVFGSDMRSVRVSEVYDPKADTWSLIKSKPPRRRERPITAVGEELFSLQLGMFSENQMDSDDAALKFAFKVDVYHPAKDKWRVEKFYSDASADFLATLFTTQGKLHRARDGCISVLNVDRKRWMLKHRYSFAGCGSLDNPVAGNGKLDPRFESLEIVVLGAELLAKVRSKSQVWLLQSEGFGGQKIDVAWHIFGVYPIGSVLPGCFMQPGFPGEMHPIEL